MTFPSTVKWHQFDYLSGGNNQYLAQNLKLSEVVQNTFMMEDEWADAQNSVPLDERILQAWNEIRPRFGNPIIPTAFYRSVRWDKSKNRDGKSQHTLARAFDAKGDGYYQFMLDTYNNKTPLYYRLRDIGVRGWGFYKNEKFVHLDFRNTSNDVVWGEEVKKKGGFFTNTTKIVASVAGVLLFLVGLVLIKNRRS